MNEKFISQLIEEFFSTGVLKCSIYQLNSILEFTRNKVKEVPHQNTEYQMWLNFYEMILVYLTETPVTLSSASEESKVSFRDYLLKVYGVGVGELDSTSIHILYEKYTNFVEQQCCGKCMYFGIPNVCIKCPCGEIYTNQTNN